MSNYTKTTDFEAKDSLPTGDSGKIIRGAEFETEFDAISTAIATKADTAGPTFTGTLTFETISDGTIGVTAFVDEDDMVSNSATLVPTQQSVKAYVDAQVTAQDLDFQADSGGALSIDLDSETLTFTGGTGIDTSGLGNAVTFAIDSTVATLTGTQTLTNKTLTSPDVNTPDIDGGTIDGATIATSDITVGTGKTLDVSGGTLTLANDQISGDKVEGGTIASTTITSLASTTVDTTNLEVTNIKAKDGTSAGSIADTTGVVTLASSVLTTTDINGGTIDGTTIGATTPAAVSATTVSATGNITVGGTVDGRDVATDGTKLDGIESGATADQTAAEIRTLVEAATDSNVFTDADHTKLDGIEANATADQTAAEIRTLVDSATDSNVFTDADHTKLDGIEAGATADQTDAEIRAAVEAATDSNVFTDADHSKLDGIEAGADVTDTTNVTAAGAVMDSELTNETAVKALNQGVATTDSPSFVAVETDEIKSTDGINITIDSDDNSSANSFTVRSGSSGSYETLISAGEDGAARLWYDNGFKLTTQSTGVEVTGVLTSDGIKTDIGVNGIIEANSTSDAIVDGASLLKMRAVIGSAQNEVGNIFIKHVGTSENTGAIVFSTMNSGTLAERLSIDSTGIDVTGIITTDGMTTSADINFGDNDKAVFGAGSDLEIYHDGSNSYIAESNTTGNLFIKGTHIYLQNSAGQDALNLINGNAFLKSGGSTKLATTSSGIDVTGTAVTDGLTSAGDAAITGGSSGSTVLTLTSNALADTPLMVFQRDGGAVAGKLAYEDTNTAMAFGTTTAHELKFLTSNTERMQIDASGQVIVNNSGGDAQINFGGISGADRMYVGRAGNDAFLWNVDTGVLKFGNNNSEAMRIDASGNLLVGTTSQYGSAGITLQQDGLVYARRTGVPSYLRRDGSDGDIIYMEKDGTAVGSIGTKSDSLFIHSPDGTNGAGLKITDGAVVPCNSDGTGSDNDTDFGNSGARFKDLYLSGNINLSASSQINSSTAFYLDSDIIHFRRDNEAESARIDSSGNLLVGTSSAGGVEGLYVAKSPSNANVGVARFDSTLANDESYTAASFVKASATTTTSQIFIKFGVDGYNSGCGQINANGVGQAAFGTNSDRRLKENVLDLPNQLESITALRPVEFDYIESEGGGHQLGFIAQEVEEIYPDAVGERHDGMKVLSGLGKWEARLVKAIQEQNEIINDLRARVAQLEGVN